MYVFYSEIIVDLQKILKENRGFLYILAQLSLMLTPDIVHHHS